MTAHPKAICSPDPQRRSRSTKPAHKMARRQRCRYRHVVSASVMPLLAQPHVPLVIGNRYRLRQRYAGQRPASRINAQRPVFHKLPECRDVFGCLRPTGDTLDKRKPPVYSVSQFSPQETVVIAHRWPYAVRFEHLQQRGRLLTLRPSSTMRTPSAASWRYRPAGMASCRSLSSSDGSPGQTA